MDRRLTIKVKTIVVDSLGEPAETLVDVATVWANKREMKSTTAFILHYRTDVTPHTVVVCEGITYDVKGVDEIGRREGLEIQTMARL
jgi:head-tail adaptor